MSGSIAVQRGERVLRQLLEEHTLELRGLDLPEFRRWLDRLLGFWRRDPVFMQRARIRDMRRIHPNLRELEREHRHAARDDANSPQFRRLSEVEARLKNTSKALTGLSEALKTALPDQHAALRQKRDGFRVRRHELEAEQQALVHANPARRHLLRVEARLNRLRAAIGLDEEEARLHTLQREQGRHSGRSGKSFEHDALEITKAHIIPDLVKRDAVDQAHIRLLRGVTLGAAGIELDQVLVRLPHQPGSVEVLALIEVKRNINDVGAGFTKRQENLAWLTGDTAKYDPSLYRTRHFRSGHFDRQAAHQQDGERFVFDRYSFRHFRRDGRSGFFLDRLFLIARFGDLWGLSSANLRRVQHRIATDEGWEPTSETHMTKLFEWYRGLGQSTEAPDVLRIYAQATDNVGQVLVARTRTE
jgi:hypothetical protein